MIELKYISIVVGILHYGIYYATPLTLTSNNMELKKKIYTLTIFAFLGWIFFNGLCWLVYIENFMHSKLSSFKKKLNVKYGVINFFKIYLNLDLIKYESIFKLLDLFLLLCFCYLSYQVKKTKPLILIIIFYVYYLNVILKQLYINK
tara:strand:- start:285 stop:725 length:441 start_codon:yes stop_codon:yes gene_type:complete